MVVMKGWGDEWDLLSKISIIKLEEMEAIIYTDVCYEGKENTFLWAFT